MGISALVLTYNEEARIARCLESLTFADELIVLDSHSTDKTLDIAKEYTSNISKRKFTGFSDQKSAAIELAKEDWILIIDADEVVSKELASEIVAAAETDEFGAYKMPRTTSFLGKCIRHCGWYPDYQLRLVRRDKACIPHRLVHETLDYNGPVGTLEHPIIHYSYDTMADYCRKMVLYTRAAAQQKYNEGRRFHIVDLLYRPWHSFIKMYVFRQGFLDGVHGLVLCGLTACSSLLRYAYLWELCSQGPSNEDQVDEK
ncbi:glycosyltransferase family 2 protein [bacterium]|nr:glycosyltransferase family 2 protein [bacterium]